MSVILYLLAASLALGAAGLALFLWSLRSGQYDDMAGAAQRILFDDPAAADAGRNLDIRPQPPSAREDLRPDGRSSWTDPDAWPPGVG